MNTCQIGRTGEDKAVRWLESNGHKILLRNFRKRGFEIDIVALDKNGVLKFVEVKTVKDGFVMDAAFSIEGRNIANYAKGIDAFLATNREYLKSSISMDAIVIVGQEGLNYYENITADLVM
jgi:putative endonuclease